MKPGTYPIMLKVDALEFAVTRDVQVTIQIEEIEAVVEIVPEEIPVAISVFPDEIFIEPTKFIDEKEFEVKVTPAIIEEIKPEESKAFLVSLTAPPETEILFCFFSS